MLLECAKCGEFLTSERAKYFVEMNMPASCPTHEIEVSDEAENGYSMWPSGWHGHNCKNNDGRWHEWPSDDGDYDIVE